jgi:nucleoside-diphosphate-sugar epimerase
MSETVLVTGGCGYVGAILCRELLDTGRQVRTLDVLLHGQSDVAEQLRRAGAEVLTGDVRDPDVVSRAVEGAHAIVHLAAVVGDPACSRDPVFSHEVNVEGSRALIAAAERAGVRLFAFASTCSNYGRMADASVPITEHADLAPVSLYAEQKVAIERELLNGRGDGMSIVCLRLATVYGVAPRMRFDLTVNEFTREMWADRHLEVFGEQFWRPYIHVRDVGRAARLVLDAPLDAVRQEVFNVGRTDQNFRKLDLVDLVRSRVPSGTVSFVERDEDPRDYKVSFDKIRDRIGYDLTMTVADGIQEIATALDAGMFPDPYDGKYRNTP